MSKQYDEYLFNHIQAVKACFNLLTNLFDIYDHDMLEHDLSKYTVDEYKAYDNYFYTNPVEEIVKKIDKRCFKYAWLHHQNTNRHHWQYWVLINDEDGIEPLEMPFMDICEMVADWGSFAYQKKDGSELIKWYESHKDKMILHETTRMHVEELVPKLASEIDEHFKEENDL